MTHTMPPDPKARLSATIYKLREQLLADFHNAADGTYRLSVPINQAELPEEHHVKRRRLEAWIDEQARRENGGKKTGTAAIRERHYPSALKLAAATFFNLKAESEAGECRNPREATYSRDGCMFQQFILGFQSQARA